MRDRRPQQGLDGVLERRSRLIGETLRGPEVTVPELHRSQRRIGDGRVGEASPAATFGELDLEDGAIVAARIVPIE